ncbi:hypothetical protein EDB92DRAFT_1604912 [Lactarius akahatsu]|uniref:Uncharacterized protein n=1 Tax=Lactarius akahatsu TaxID=416441 RepID=A0AAD4LA17_9AGAM|nr:hypothetical protein EDB92DRAFT_1604912 [Lactarius akahatsu]
MRICWLRTGTAPFSSSSPSPKEYGSYFPVSSSCGRYDAWRPSMPRRRPDRLRRDPAHDHWSRGPNELPLLLCHRPEQNLAQTTHTSSYTPRPGMIRRSYLRRGGVYGRARSTARGSGTSNARGTYPFYVAPGVAPGGEVVCRPARVWLLDGELQTRARSHGARWTRKRLS